LSLTNTRSSVMSAVFMTCPRQLYHAQAGVARMGFTSPPFTATVVRILTRKQLFSC
jgi:hypothetical protein